LIGTIVVVVGLVVGAIAIFTIRHPKQTGTEAGSTPASSTSSVHSAPNTAPSTARSTSASKTPSSTVATTSLSPSRSFSSTATKPVSIVVLNNTTTTGLAGQVAKQFRQAGWNVTKDDNYPGNDIISSCAYYDPSVPGAMQAAEALQTMFPAIKRVKPQFGELAVWKSPIVVILVQDWLQS
jgi:hypothetical protein